MIKELLEMLLVEYNFELILTEDKKILTYLLFYHVCRDQQILIQTWIIRQ